MTTGHVVMRPEVWHEVSRDWRRRSHRSTSLPSDVDMTAAALSPKTRTGRMKRTCVHRRENRVKGSLAPSHQWQRTGLCRRARSRAAAHDPIGVRL